MFAEDFLFHHHRASDFGFMICSFDGDSGTVSGGEIEYHVVKTPDRDKFTFYNSQFNTALVWNFSICKDPFKNDNLYFDQYEESQVAKWLLKTDGYHWFQFDQDGYEDIFYRVYINMVPHQISGRTVGFDLTVTSDCAYGFTDIITKKATINSSTPLKLNIHSDINTYILPYIKINGVGDFYLSNDSDLSQNQLNGKETHLMNVKNITVMDSENDMIGIWDSEKEIITDFHSPNDFNWYFLRLVNGVNIITTNFQNGIGENGIEIEIKYREPRRVIV